MSTTAPERRTRGRGRKPQEGPRATLRQLLPFLLEHKLVLGVVAALSIFGALTTLAQPLLVGQIIERVQNGEALGYLVWAIVALVVVNSLISGYQHYLLQRTGTAVVYSSRRQLIARILRLPISEFDARRTGDIVSRVGTDTTLLYAVLTQGLADAVGNVLVFVGALVAMAFIDPVLLLSIVVVIGVSVVGVTLLSGRIRTATQEQQEKVGELASSVERAVGSIRTVRASGATERESQAITGIATDVYGVGVRIAKVSALIVPIAGIALQVSLLVVLGLGGYRVASGAISVANLVTFVMFLFLLIAPLGSFFGAITSVNQALGALGRIQEVLDLPSEDAHDAAIAAALGAASAATDRSPVAIGGPDAQIVTGEQGIRDASTFADAPAIEFRDVRFRYPEAVVAARRKAESEALAVLENAHVDTSAVDIPEAVDAPGVAGRRGAARRLVLGAARCAGRARRALGRRQEHDARPDRAVLRPDGRRDPRGRTRTSAPSTATTCALGSATSSRMPPPWPAPSPRICGSPRRRHPIRTASACCAR